jgi:para-nitrobenzyl esterase
MKNFISNASQRRIVFLVACILIFTGWAGAQITNKPVITPTVNTAYGQLKGTIDQETIIWKGVPYASAPVDLLRWAPPKDPVPWIGLREATKPAMKCTQLLTTEEWIRTGVVDPDSSEDCPFQFVLGNRWNGW